MLTIPSCHELCPLHLFKQLTIKVSPKDWMADCKLRWTDIIYKITITMNEYQDIIKEHKNLKKEILFLKQQLLEKERKIQKMEFMFGNKK